MSRPSWLLDTNSCIYLIARTEPALALRVSRSSPGSIGLSAIVAAELALGFDRLGPEGAETLARFFAIFPVVDFDRAAASAYARVPFRRGKLDRLIAAHALSLDATLITNNEDDFNDVPELKVENWTRSL